MFQIKEQKKLRYLEKGADSSGVNRVNCRFGNSDYDKMFLNTRVRHNKQSVILSILIDSGARSNLISYTSLCQLGKRKPHIRPDPLVLKGAGGIELNSLGTVDLAVKLGDREKILKFYVISDLATNCLIGREALVNAGAKLDFRAHTIEFSDGSKRTLHDPSATLPVFATRETLIKPGETCFLQCDSGMKPMIKGSYISVTNYKYDMPSNIVDLKGHSKFGLYMGNDTTKNIRIKRNEKIGHIKPVVTNYNLQIVSQDDISDIANELNKDTNFTVKQSKKKSAKPLYSRPLVSLDGLTDEEIIDKNIKYNNEMECETLRLNKIRRFKFKVADTISSREESHCRSLNV